MDSVPGSKERAVVRPQGKDDWEAQRSTIQELYRARNMTLQKVMATMEEEHGFKATKKQYETRLKEWNLGKKITTEEKAAMSRIRKRRLEQEQPKKTLFTVYGEHVSGEKIDRYDRAAIKRARQEQPTVDSSSHPSEVAPTPPQIQYSTPLSFNTDNPSGEWLLPSTLTDDDQMSRFVIRRSPSLPDIPEVPYPGESQPAIIHPATAFPSNREELGILGMAQVDAIEHNSSDEDYDMIEDEDDAMIEDEDMFGDEFVGTPRGFPLAFQNMSISSNSSVVGQRAGGRCPGVDPNVVDQSQEAIRASPLDVLDSADSCTGKDIGEAYQPTFWKAQQLPEDPSLLVCLGSEHTPIKREDDVTSQFLAAAQKGDMVELRRGLRYCVLVNDTCDQGVSALHYASYMGHEDAVRTLLSNGANAAASVRGTVLHDRKEIPSPKPIRLAAIAGKIGVVAILLEEAANLSSHEQRLEQQAYLDIAEPAMTLPWALNVGQDEIACRLFSLGTRINIVPSVGYTGPGYVVSPVQLRSESSDEMFEAATIHVLQFLNTILDASISEVADVRTGAVRSPILIRSRDPARLIGPDQKPITIYIDYSHMRSCIDFCFTNIISQIIPFFTHQRDVDGWSLLHHAAISGNASVMASILSTGINPTVPTQVGNTPLHLIVGPGVVSLEGETDLIQGLLHVARETLINAPNQSGYTPLHIASQEHRVQAIEQLLVSSDTAQQNANPNAEALDTKITPLDLALSGCSSSLETAQATTERLLRAGANINHAGQRGLTALHHAARAQNAPLVKLLLSFGASCQLRDDDKMTPLNYAVGGHLLDEPSGFKMPFHTPHARNLEPVPPEPEILSILFGSLSDNEQTAVIHEDGDELLRLAIAGGADLAAARFLLERGAVTDREGVANYSALKLAATRDSRGFATLILENAISGAKMENTASKGQGTDAGCYDKLFALANAFLDESPVSAIVREECATIFKEHELQERLAQLADERGFPRLADFWANQTGTGYCTPANIFGWR